RKVVYISCSPDSLARDLGIITKGGYKVEKAVPVDMFPFRQPDSTPLSFTLHTAHNTFPS
ncbi:MAG: hypothetical protein II138_04535, partial [Paludibacteraceae bacterium]|nr:hypothetical protein [Paludibacteraceae bacterium]